MVLETEEFAALTNAEKAKKVGGKFPELLKEVEINASAVKAYCMNAQYRDKLAELGLETGMTTSLVLEVPKKKDTSVPAKAAKK